MKTFDKHSKMQDLMAEFKKYDQKHFLFIQDIENKIFDITSDHYSIDALPANFHEHIRSFAIALINNTYSVIEKDSHYPEYRMKIELRNFSFLLRQYPGPSEKNEFTKAFSTLIKSAIVEAFPAVYDLSANGFRLLEKSLNYHLNIFLNTLYSTE